MPLHTNDTPKRDYRITVRNFGPIAKGAVELRPLTVFIGPSNTGKSYLATLIYALHRCLLNSQRTKLPEPSHIDPDVLVLAELGQWASQTSSASNLPSIPPRLASFIRSVLEDATGLDRKIDREASRCFGVDGLAELIRFPRARVAHISLRMPRQQTRGSFQYDVRIRKNATEVIGNISNDAGLLADTKDSSYAPVLRRYAAQLGRAWQLGSDQPPSDQPASDLAHLPIDVFYFDYVLQLLTEAVRNQLLTSFTRSPYYLPADRTGVMHSHKVVVSALVRRAATGGIRPAADVPMLSGVLADFLDGLIQMPGEGKHRQTRRSKQLARTLERTVLQGAVQIQFNDTSYPEFFFRPDGWNRDLPLMRTSSMVAELAPIVLYLRNIVRPGDVLIIEEPEAHLHPAIQVELVRLLARVVNAGIRVIITTHSSWLMEQVGNLVRLSNLSPDERKHLAKSDVALSPSEIGVWLFKVPEGANGSVVEEIDIDPDTGLFPADYDAVSEALYNEGAKIFNRLQEISDE